MQLIEGVPYPDHYLFSRADFGFLTRLAAERDARLVTTEKDFVRLPADMKDKVMRLRVRVHFEDEAAFSRLLSGVSV